MVRLRNGRSSARRAESAAYGEYTEYDEHGEAQEYDQPVEAQVVDLDDEEPNASDDARAIRFGCEAIVRYIAPYVEHVRGDVPALEAVRLAEARALVDEALALLA
jgi:hypothetical protein